MTNLEMVLTVSTSVTVVLGAWFLVAKFLAPGIKRISKWMKTWEHFMEDWFGEDERDGRSATPGVMARLNAIDGELKKNGGSSIKDSVDRIETNIIKIDKRLEEGNQRFRDIEKRLDDLEN